MLTITQILFLMKVIDCVHIEHEHYEEVEKYYQYGYQVDDHYTGSNIIDIFCWVRNISSQLFMFFIYSLLGMVAIHLP